MIENIIELLQIARNQKWRGEYIDVAMGKNKHPESLKEIFKLRKYGKN